MISAEPIIYQFRAMGGYGEIVLAGVSSRDANAICKEAQDEVERIERKYSRYRTDSFLSAMNQQCGSGSLSCDEETLALMDSAETLYQASGGLFDLTSGVLRHAWDFEKGALPDPGLLSDLLAQIDWRAVHRKDDEVSFSIPGMQIDFGGIGKEYAADRAAAVLQAAGIVSGYINLSGDFHVLGPKPNGQPWMIGIQNPRHKGQVFASMPIEKGALATSGDYERFFERDGKRYCHILNPVTGYPVTYWRSISVFAPMTVMAGSFSTIAMLLEEGGLQFLQDSGLPFLAMNQSCEVFQQQVATP